MKIVQEKYVSIYYIEKKKISFRDLRNTFGDWVESVKERVKKIEDRYLGTHRTYH